MALPLQQLHLLVTRPKKQAEKWSQQLQALGASVTFQPVMEIIAVKDESCRQQIIDRVLSFSEYQKAIFISQNAVQYGMQWLDQYWPQLPLGVDFFAIGEATACKLQSALDAMGGASLYVAQQAMNSEVLLMHPQLQNVEDEKIVIFRGRGGRTVLADELTARGATVDYCELYMRQCPYDSPQSLNKAYRETVLQAITTVHSGESLQNLCTMIEENDKQWLQQQPLLVPGKRVFDEAIKAGFIHVIQAENATHESMVAALQEWKVKVKL